MHEIEYVFPQPDELDLLEQTTSLIASYAREGLILEQSLDFFIKLAAQNLLVLAVQDAEVVGSAALTYELPIPGAYEFGAWAVSPKVKGQGVGKKLYAELFDKVKDNPKVKRVIAYANGNSGPLLKPLGVVIDQSTLPDKMFSGCLRCNCAGKENLTNGQRCVDLLIDLTQQLKTS